MTLLPSFVRHCTRNVLVVGAFFMLHASLVHADEPLECRKSYVTEFCGGTMFVALAQAQQAGETALMENIKEQWAVASPAYKGSVVFDEEEKKGIMKKALDNYSLENVAGCIGKNKNGFKNIADAAHQYCRSR